MGYCHIRYIPKKIENVITFLNFFQNIYITVPGLLSFNLSCFDIATVHIWYIYKKIENVINFSKKIEKLHPIGLIFKKKLEITTERV